MTKLLNTFYQNIGSINNAYIILDELGIKEYKFNNYYLYTYKEKRHVIEEFECPVNFVYVIKHFFDEDIESYIKKYLVKKL